MHEQNEKSDREIATIKTKQNRNPRVEKMVTELKESTESFKK